MTAAPRIESRLRWALLILTVAKGWVWIGVTPVWKVVDEPAHFDNVQFRAERFLAPRWNRQPLNAVMNPGASSELQTSWKATQRYWRGRYLAGARAVPEEAALVALAAHQEARLSDGQMLEMSYPGLYYDLAAVPYLALQHCSILTRAFAVRVLSLLFGLMAVLCTFEAARRVLSCPWLAFAAAAVVALQPMESQQTAAVNNDAAVIGLGALVFYLQVRMLANWPAAPGWKECAALGAVAGLTVLAKPHGVALVPGCAVVLLVGLYRVRRERAAWYALAAAVGAFAVFAIPAAVALGETTYVLDALNRMTRPRAEPVHVSFPIWYLRLRPEFHEGIFRSYWGRFGWTEFDLNGEWFDWLHGVVRLFWGGLVVAIAARLVGVGRRWWSWRGLALSAGTIVLVYGFIWFTEYRAQAHLGIKFIIQGRNYLVALPALAIVAVIAFGSPAPRRLRPAVAAGIVGGAALLNLAALLTIARYHYGN